MTKYSVKLYKNERPERALAILFEGLDLEKADAAWQSVNLSLGNEPLFRNSELEGFEVKNEKGLVALIDY